MQKARSKGLTLAVFMWGLALAQTRAQTIYTPYTFATMAGQAGSRFGTPYGLAVDTAGNLYVSEHFGFVIRKMTPSGVITTLAGQYGTYGTNDGTGTAARFYCPAGLALDAIGNVYVADSFNHTIRRVSPLGVVTTLAGQAGIYGTNDGIGSTAQFNGPYGVAVDKPGNVYVSDGGNYTIRKLTPVGTNWMVTTLAGQPGAYGTNDGVGSDARFNSPAGVALDRAGNLYVADMSNLAIRKLTPSGTNWVVTTPIGQAGNGGTNDGAGDVARFNNIFGVAVDDAGELFVADLNLTIRKATPVGTNWVVTTLAGSPGVVGTKDGTGSAALFNPPYGIAVDGAGNVYVSDIQNATIRRGFIANGPPVLVPFGSDFGFSDGLFGFDVAGPPNQAVVIESSADLVNWLPIWTNVIGPSALKFNDQQSGAYVQRYYRARTP